MSNDTQVKQEDNNSVPHTQVTALLDGTHCPKHGVEWEACCLAEVSLELHMKIMTLFATVRKEAFKEAIKIVQEQPSTIGYWMTQAEVAANLRRKIVWALEAKKGEGNG